MTNAPDFIQASYEEVSRAKSAAHDDLLAADRRAHANQNALEEARTMLEQADRARRQMEQELADSNETLGDQTCQNQVIDFQILPWHALLIHLTS